MTDFKEQIIRQLDQQYVNRPLSKKEREDMLYWAGYEQGKFKIQHGTWNEPKGLSIEEHSWWWAGFCGGVSDTQAKAH